MSKLHETNYQGVKGWQWGDGPIYIGDGRRWAIEYGKALQRLKELKALADLQHDHVHGEERLEMLEAQQAIVEGIKKWRLHWLNGTAEIGLGKTISEAFTALGYGAGAMQALDHYEEVK